jgi:hypothetical protein
MGTSVRLNSTTYALGDLVIPISAPPVGTADLTNPIFELGNTGWTLGSGWAINTAGAAYQGTWRAIRSGGAGNSNLVNNNKVAVVPGQTLTVGIVLQANGATAAARVGIRWRNAGNVVIVDSLGSEVKNTAGVWKSSTLTAAAPGTAAFAEFLVNVIVGAGSGETVLADSATWSYAFLSIPPPFIYECTVTGTTGISPPIWPTVLGATVMDGTVEWTTREAIRVTWTAVPIMKSGATEPVWPTFPGGLIADNTISWKATTLRIEDTRCPNSKVVTIIASKVWAADEDIVRFCATVNAKDWTTADDAGYLPTGLQQYGSNETAVLNIYRGNLVPFSGSTFQMWGVDPDPAANAIIDAMEGIGSIYHKASHPVGNELFFLASLGVRTVGIAAGSTNLAAGDVGMPIDSLVQDSVEEAIVNGYTPLGIYYPSAGQYWLALGPLVWVYTMNAVGQVGAWTRYVFPFPIIAFAQLDNDLYLRDANAVRVLSDAVSIDEMPNASPTHDRIPFDSVIQWPWIDTGQVGQTNMMVGFDVVGTGIPDVQFGYDQSNLSLFTPAYLVDPDTLLDGIITMPLSCPTISPKITYHGAEDSFWSLQLLNLYWQR